MDHQFSSPIKSIYSNMVAEPRFFAHEEDECDVKASLASPTRSPTTIFAVDELSSVFRVSDDAIERGSYLDGEERETGSISRRRCLSSFTTDGELSTFSEDTEEGDDEDARSSDNDDHFRFPSRRRQSPLSIFRPVNGIKRACDFEDDIMNNSTKRRCTAPPMLCHANPIRSDSDSDDSYDNTWLSSSFSLAVASPFKRICRSNPITTSSYTPLFAEALPIRADTFSITSKYLQHPLSFPILKSADVFIKHDDAKEEDSTRKEN